MPICYDCGDPLDDDTVTCTNYGNCDAADLQIDQSNNTDNE